MCVEAWWNGQGWQWSYYVEQTECWQDFYDEGKSPYDAVVEDLEAGL